MRVRRIDLGSLAAPVRRADGSIIVEARIARTGVQTYRNADGSSRIEYRPDSEVTRSMQSMRLVPLTNLHPATMGDASQWRSISVGAVGENIRRDGQWIVAPLAVHDGATVKQMDAGELRQVSAGYDCELDETPGTTPDGDRYDAVQRDITINHVALVPNARAGKDAAVRMDAAFGELEASGRTYRSDAMDPKELAELQVKAERRKQERDDAQKALETERAARADLQKKFDALEGERDELKAQLAKADKARTDAEAAVPGRVKARVELETKAREILGSRFDGEEGDGDEGHFDGKSDRDIKLAVIKHVTDADVPSDKSDEYVNARFDAACERALTSAETFRAANDIIAANDLHTDALDSERAKTDKARQDMLDANRNGWRPAGTFAQPANK